MLDALVVSPHPDDLGGGRPEVSPDEARRRIAGHSGPDARPLIRPDARTPGVFRALLGLTVASAVLYAASILRNLLPGAAQDIADSLPEGSAQSPAMTAEAIEGDIQPG